MEIPQIFGLFAFAQLLSSLMALLGLPPAEDAPLRLSPLLSARCLLSSTLFRLRLIQVPRSSSILSSGGAMWGLAAFLRPRACRLIMGVSTSRHPCIMLIESRNCNVGTCGLACCSVSFLCDFCSPPALFHLFCPGCARRRNHSTVERRGQDPSVLNQVLLLSIFHR